MKTFTIHDISLVPQYGVIPSRSLAALRPYIMAAPMDTVCGYDLTKKMLELGEYPIVCRYLKQDWENSLRDFWDHPLCFFALPALKDISTYLEIIDRSINKYYFSDFKINVAVDIAHGDSIVAQETIKYLRSQEWVGDIISGSVCTKEGAQRSLEWGANWIRCGVGPGVACSTRVITGFGVPQASAIEQIASVVGKNLIADGGIQTSGDANKYLALGATHIMLGSKLSKTTESSGWTLKADKLVKQFRGQASNEFMIQTLGKSSKAPEGVSSKEFSPEGSLEDVIEYFRAGARGAISYAGGAELNDLKGTPYCFITESGAKEGRPNV